MKQKQNKSLQMHVIYLIVLLVLVLVYAVFFYPRMSAQTALLSTQYSTLAAQNDMLSLYELRLTELDTDIRATQDAYDADTTLQAAASFTNLISTAADAAGVTLDSVTVQEDPEVTLGAYAGLAHTAVIEVSIPLGVAPERFLQELESNTGVGMYVKSLSYQPPKSVEGEGEDAGSAHKCTVSVTCYTLTK